MPAILEPWLERDEAILVDVYAADECAREHRADARLDTPPRLRAAAVARLSGKQLAPVRTSGKRTRQAAEVPYARADRALAPRGRHPGCIHSPA